MNVQARRADDNTLVWDETLNLDSGGNTSFVEFNPTGAATIFGTGIMEDFLISVPTQGPFNLLQPYGFHDQFTIESVLVTPGLGFSTIVSTFVGNNTWSITATPVDIAAFYSAIDSTSTYPDVNNVPAPLSGGSIVGTIQLVDSQVILHLNNVIMATLDGSSFGEPDLNITADFTWFGSVNNPVPEPTTGVLLSLGLVGLAVRSRRSR